MHKSFLDENERLTHGDKKYYNCLLEWKKKTNWRSKRKNSVIYIRLDFWKQIDKIYTYVFILSIITMEHWNKSHWLSWTRFYRSWFSIKERCRNPKSINYKNYGWRWINYDERRECFENFKQDMYVTYFEWATIDRIDTNWNYCIENCRWATYKQQANNRRNNERITIDWITKNIMERADHYKIDWRTLYSRIRSWMSKIEALTKPVEERHKKVEYNWFNLSLRERSEKLWIEYKTLYRRLYIKKYPIEIALSSKRFDWKKLT